MNLLLDTHVALWAITDHPNLSNIAREMIMSPHHTIWLSAVSVWEIAIKHRLHPALMTLSGSIALQRFYQAGYQLLNMTAEHTTTVNLPMHHRDPFDRMLIAQALIEPMHLVTTDKILRQYSNTIILV